MSNKVFDLLLVALAAIVALIFNLSGVENVVLRAVLGILLLLFLPGYALTAGLFHSRDIDLPTRIILIFGTSLIVGVVGGLALHASPWGLQTQSWAAFLTAVVMVGVGVALFRRLRPAQEMSPAPDARRVQFDFTLSQFAMMGTALVLTLAAILIAFNNDLNQQYSGFTQLWIVPGEAGIAEVGLASGEHTPMHYRLTIEADGELLIEDTELTLQPDERWQTEITLPQRYTLVEATLYLADRPDEAYRHVTLKG